jgi:hypothetical protein
MTKSRIYRSVKMVIFPKKKPESQAENFPIYVNLAGTVRKNVPWSFHTGKMDLARLPEIDPEEYNFSIALYGICVISKLLE